MARAVRIRLKYTGERSKLSRLEEAVEKDPRLSPTKKAEITDLIRKLVGHFLDLDNSLPPVLPAALSPRRRVRQAG